MALRTNPGPWPACFWAAAALCLTVFPVGAQEVEPALLRASANTVPDTRLRASANTVPDAPLPTSADTVPDTPLRVVRGAARLSFETLEISRQETMGLMGLGFLLDLGPHLYAGGSGYGAVRGERGGFFTGGVSAGVRARVTPRLELDAGGFFGGGGGGAAPQGGGMMVRTQAGGTLELGSLQAGAGLSWVTFPNGDIDSKQVFVSLAARFSELYAPQSLAGTSFRAPAAGAAPLRVAETRWMATGGAYLPGRGSRTTDGASMTSTVSLVGVEVRRVRGAGPLFLSIQAAGASGGRSDGFAEIFAGAGARLPVVEGRLFVEASAEAGAAGGGRIHTGGGGAARIRGGLEAVLTPSFTVGASAGHLRTGGEFSAAWYQGRVGYRFGDVRLQEGTGTVAPGAGLALSRWRVGVSHQTVPGAERKGRDPKAMSLLGLRIDRFLGPNLYLTGQAYGAHSGEAGGYASGLMGAGMERPLPALESLSASAEVTGGASGGGGVDVGGGSTLQAQVGLHWRIRHGAELYVGGGRILSSRERLNSPFLTLGMGIGFARAGG